MKQEKLLVGLLVVTILVMSAVTIYSVNTRQALQDRVEAQIYMSAIDLKACFEKGISDYFLLERLQVFSAMAELADDGGVTEKLAKQLLCLSDAEHYNALSYIERQQIMSVLDKVRNRRHNIDEYAEAVADIISMLS